MGSDHNKLPLFLYSQFSTETAEMVHMATSKDICLKNPIQIFKRFLIKKS